MNAHAAATRHVSDDRITGDRLTALGVPNHQSVDALNAYAFRPADAIDEPVQFLPQQPSRTQLARVTAAARQITKLLGG